MKDRRAYIVLFLFIGLIVGGYMASSGARKQSAKPPNLSAEAGNMTQPRPTSSWQLKDSGDEQILVGNVETGPTKIAEADWKTGLELVTKLENDVFMKPDPSQVGNFMTPSCACYQATVTQLTNLQKNRQHVGGANIAVTGSSLIREPKPNQVELLVSLEAKGFNTVDANGNAIEIGPAGVLEPFRYILEKGSDGRWRIAERHT